MSYNQRRSRTRADYARAGTEVIVGSLPPTRAQRSTQAQFPASERFRISEPTSKWPRDFEITTLNVEHEKGVNWKALVPYTLSAQERASIDRTTRRILSDIHDHDVQDFWVELEQLNNALYPEKAAGGQQPYANHVLIAPMLAPVGRSTTAQMMVYDSESEFEEEEDVVPSPAVLPRSTREGSADTTSSDNSSTLALAHPESGTKSMRSALLLILEKQIRADTGICINRYQRTHEVFNWLSRDSAPAFRSNNDDSCCYRSDDVYRKGGAEIIGIEDKCKGTSHTPTAWSRLRTQVTGEMLASLYHRHNAWGYSRNAELTVMANQPSFEFGGTTESRTMFYLVFAHRCVSLACMPISEDALKMIFQGTRPTGDKTVVRWTKRLRLYRRDGDLQEAIEMIMTLHYYHIGLWRTGRHFWRPYVSEEGVFIG